jgi:alkyl hydroperoxide reductase subunit AhpC
VKTVLVGTPAPDFDLAATQGPGTERRQIKLSDYQDGWLMLVFYPRDFSLI